MSRSQQQYLLVLCVNATVPAVVLWNWYSGDVSSTMTILIAAVSAAVFNAVLIYSIREKQRRLGNSTPRRLPAIATVLAFMAVLMTALGVKTIPVRNDYLGLALSEKPLSEIQPEQKRLVVELIRNRAANSREYDQVLAEAKAHPISPALYTPESFANVDVIHRTVTTLSKYIDVDMNYGTKQQEVMSEFRQKMAKVDPEYLKEFDSARQDSEQLQASATALEKQWFTGVVALYDFAATHYDEIKLYDRPGGNVGKTAQQFKEQIEASKAVYAKWQDQLRELVRRQNTSRAHNLAYVP